MARSKNRPLEACESEVACTQEGCNARRGTRCGYTLLNGKRVVSVLPHVERKRAYGRALKVRTVADVLRPYVLGSMAGEAADRVVRALDALNALRPSSERGE